MQKQPEDASVSAVQSGFPVEREYARCAVTLNQTSIFVILPESGGSVRLGGFAWI
ncbi:MAG: hypothetical protein M1167_04670 [Chloroflexi bacterium]|nr:hypothetical protein [Chloroflexota bacterium]